MSGTSAARKTWMLGSSAAAMITIPTLGPLVGGGENAEDVDTEITPPNYAFSVWAPIFAAVAANAAQRALSRESLSARDDTYWISGAYAMNAAWSVAAQAGRWRLTAPLLATAAALAGVAYSKAQPQDRMPTRKAVQHLGPISHGALFGWTSLAAVINAFAVPNARLRTSQETWAPPAAALAATALSSVVVTSTSTPGALAVALPPAWGLATLSADSRRMPRTRIIAAAGAAWLTGAATIGRLCKARRGGKKRRIL